MVEVAAEGVAEGVAAQGNGGPEFFMQRLLEQLSAQSLQEAVSAAKEGEWERMFGLLAEGGFEEEDTSPVLKPGAAPLVVEQLNTVPPGRAFAMLHQVAYHGDKKKSASSKGKGLSMSVQVV